MKDWPRRPAGPSFVAYPRISGACSGLGRAPAIARPAPTGTNHSGIAICALCHSGLISSELCVAESQWDSSVRPAVLPCWGGRCLRPQMPCRSTSRAPAPSKRLCCLRAECCSPALVVQGRLSFMLITHTYPYAGQPCHPPDPCGGAVCYGPL